MQPKSPSSFLATTFRMCQLAQTLQDKTMCQTGSTGAGSVRTRNAIGLWRASACGVARLIALRSLQPRAHLTPPLHEEPPLVRQGDRLVQVLAITEVVTQFGVSGAEAGRCVKGAEATHRRASDAAARHGLRHWRAYCIERCMVCSEGGVRHEAARVAVGADLSRPNPRFCPRYPTRTCDRGNPVV